MKAFSRLCQQLESAPFHRDKAAMVADYLLAAPRGDAAYAVFLLSGGQLAPVVTPALLEAWIIADSGLPEWLWRECREQAADLAEAVALVTDTQRTAANAKSGLSLGAWTAERLRPLALKPEAERRAEIRGWWRSEGLQVEDLWAVLALALGRFPVHLPRRTIEDALERASRGARGENAEPREEQGDEWLRRLRAEVAALSESAASVPSPQLSMF